jgi:hypothetical protein
VGVDPARVLAEQCPHEDRRDRGWVAEQHSPPAEKEEGERSVAESGALEAPAGPSAVSGFAPLAAASSCHGCKWPCGLQALVFSTSNNLTSGRVRKWPQLLGLTRNEE